MRFAVSTVSLAALSQLAHPIFIEVRTIVCRVWVEESVLGRMKSVRARIAWVV